MKVPRPRHERLAEFYRRLAALPPAENIAEARAQIDETLTDVENDLTEIPNNPVTLGNDGRLYPPQDDNRRPVPGRADLIRFRSRRHNTFIGANGSIEIQAVDDGKIEFEKPGADGRKVWDR